MSADAECGRLGGLPRPRAAVRAVTGRVAVRIAARKHPVFPSDDEATNGRDMCAATTERQTLECFAWKGGVDGAVAWCGFGRAS